MDLILSTLNERRIKELMSKIESELEKAIGLTDIEELLCIEDKLIELERILKRESIKYNIAGELMKLKITHKIDTWGGMIHLVILDGYLDGATVVDFSDVLGLHMNNDPNQWAFDFKKLSYMSSAGIGQIIKLLSVLKDRNGRVCVIGANKSIVKVFEMVGLEDKVRMFDNIDDAKDRFI